MNNISIMYLLQLAWKRIWLLIIAMVIFAIAAFGYCKFFATKRYSAKATIIVTNGSIVNTAIDEYDDSIATSDLSASNNLSIAVTELLKTGNVYDSFVEEYGEKYNMKKGSTVRGMTSVVRREKTNPFIDITVTSTNPEIAKNMANDLADFACKYAVENFFKKAEILPADEARYASLVYPRTLFTTAIAGVAGVLVMYAIVFLFDSLNQSIRGEEEFSMKFDIPIIGSVPDFGDTEIIGSYYKKGGYGSVK